MITRYVIMANGRGTRWGGHNGIPKHLIEFEGETLLRRVTRQILEADRTAQVIISAANPMYNTEGARRHKPLVNEAEIDRFPLELITDPVCFLYGDTLYSDEAIVRILATPLGELDFFGTERGIVAVRAGRGMVLKRHCERVRRLYFDGQISSCAGWAVYQSYTGLPFDGVQIGEGFHVLREFAIGFNTPAEWDAFERSQGALLAPSA